jgi:hypothetical protein
LGTPRLGMPMRNFRGDVDSWPQLESTKLGIKTNNAIIQRCLRRMIFPLAQAACVCQ